MEHLLTVTILIDKLSDDNDEITVKIESLSEKLIKLYSIKSDCNSKTDEAKQKIESEEIPETDDATVETTTCCKKGNDETQKEDIKFQIETELRTYFDKSFEELILSLCKSILVGEFIVDFDAFKENIQKIEQAADLISEPEKVSKAIQNIGHSVSPISPKVGVELLGLLEDRVEPYKEILLDILTCYKRLAKHIMNLNHIGRDIILFDLADETKVNLSKRVDSSYKTGIDQYERLFYYIHDLLKRDAKQKFTTNLNNDLKDAEECLIELIQVRKKIIKLNFKPSKKEAKKIKDAALEKCNFLIRKYIITLEKRRKSHELNFSIGLDGEYFRLNKQFDHFKPQSDDFRLLDNYCVLINNEKIGLFDLFETTDPLVESKYPKWITHYTSLRTRQQEFLGRAEKISIENKVETTKHPKSFEEYGALLRSNFLHNSYFDIKLLSDKEIYGYQYFSVQYESLKAQFPLDHSYIQNFYPFYKLSQAINEYLETRLIGEGYGYEGEKKIRIDAIKEEYDNNNKLIQNIQNELLDIQIKYRLKWCKSNYYYRYQLPYSESIFSHDSIQVYVMSSFVLPIDYETVYDNIDKLSHQTITLKSLNEHRLTYLQAAAKTKEGVKKFKNSTKMLLDNSKREIEKDQKNMQGLIAIFLAVTAIVVGGSNIVSNIQSVAEGVLYLSYYAFIFYIFFAVYGTFSQLKAGEYEWNSAPNKFVRRFGIALLIALLSGTYFVSAKLEPQSDCDSRKVNKDYRKEDVGQEEKSTYLINNISIKEQQAAVAIDSVNTINNTKGEPTSPKRANNK
ncbi:hypothetical protein [Saccharicrinis aurantiacus]|uniref:hypothetical protein n=1 Tax=Saccharicrinis aurantiacus TaxID=1849719 RepID=UPI0024928B68|nr:hypothetical protein [Saccharicrinis aurantiacus]